TGLHDVWLDHETRAVMCAKRATRAPLFRTPAVQRVRREAQAPRQRTNRLPIDACASNRLTPPRRTRHVQRDRQVSFPLTTTPSPRTTTRSVTVRLLLPAPSAKLTKTASARALVALDRRHQAAVRRDTGVPGSEGA